MSITPPPISRINQNQILDRLRAMAPHFTPEWSPREEDPGSALLKIFSFLIQGTLDRLNQAPRRNMLAFLDLLGIRLLPKMPAEAFLRFRVIDGAPGHIDVPARTLATSPSDAGELAFETNEPIRANRGKLVGIFAIDPENDAIYQPPRGFLEKEFVGPQAPSYMTTAFSSAGSQTVQLQLVDGIEPGDTLRIGDNDFAVVEIKGLIVQLAQKLPVNVNEQATVFKRTTFELFKGINHQEHVLYLSHPEYFKLKEKAIITLEVRAWQTGDTTELVWECLSGDPTLETGWTKLVVGRDDTNGLSRDGAIELLKPAVEIKEDSIGEQAGRWIRARRVQPIALGDRLSRLESVAIKVSAGASIPAEAGFYNESPLPVGAPPFNPLGFEPQLFDRFHIASDEAFSKHGAEVALNFKLDQSRLLGPPVAAVGASAVPRVFARGVLMRLVEVDFGPKRKFFESKDAPAQIAPGAIPAIVAAPGSDLMAVFVRCQDDAVHLFKSSSIGAQDGWTILDQPGPKVALDPAAIFFNGEWNVFVVTDGKLWRKPVPTSGGAGAGWSTLSNPASDFTPASAPAAAVDHSGRPAIFVFDDKNKLWRVDWQAGAWEDQIGEKLPTAALADQDEYQCESAQSAHPFAINGAAGFADAAVFFRNKLGDIVGVRSDTEFKNFQTPGVKAAADATCISYLNSAGDDEFVIFAPFGGDGRLYSVTVPPDLSVSGVWSSEANPQPVADRPFSVSVFDTQWRLFAASSQSSMLRLSVRTETGAIEAGPKELMLFSQDVPLTNANDRFVRLNPSDPAELPHELHEPFTASRAAAFSQPLNNPVAKNVAYQLLEELNMSIGASTTTDITLTSSTPTALSDLWLFVNSASASFVQLQPVSANVNTITFVSALAAAPSPSDCRIFRLLHAGSTPEDASSRVLLDSNARPFASAYDGADIKIGNAVATHVTGYDSANRVAVLRTPFSAARGNPYSFPEQWDQVQDPSLDDIDPVLSWEYWNGTSWVNLRLGWAKTLGPNNRPYAKDETKDLVNSGSVRFVVPDDIATVEIAGQTHYWIRARLVGGNYGEVKFETTAKPDPSGNIVYSTERRDLSRPPIVAETDGLTIQYALTEFYPPQVLQTFNNLNYVDETAASVTAGKSFRPFVPLDVQTKALYLGLDQQFSHPRLLLALQNEQAIDEKRKLDWDALFQNDFNRIEAEDDSGAFTHTGLVRLVAPFEPEKRQLLGVPAYWIRAKLRGDDWPQSPELAGVFLNAVRAKQLRTVDEEILGGSDGTPGQRFQFQKIPVFEEEIRVRTVLTDEDRNRITKADGEDAVFDITDENQAVIETWVLWKEVTEFFDSRYDSRHYRLDHASGELEFGDGRHGAIPPIAGDNIRAFKYRFGGGKAGNVDVNTIKSLVTALGGIDAVTNPIPAGGGSDEATREQMLVLGPAQLNHRDRAVSTSDYEWLALEASREVVKARCEPNRDSEGISAPGWVSVYIVARSDDAQPSPPLELCRAVRAYLLKKAPAIIGWQQHIFVGRPVYVPVSVTITVVATSLALAAEAENTTRATLEHFLHPLKGGPQERGWEFGQGLPVSTLYTEIEKISAVDHVVSLSMTPTPNRDDYLELQPNQILASGNHAVTVTAVEEAQTWP